MICFNEHGILDTPFAFFLFFVLCSENYSLLSGEIVHPLYVYVYRKHSNISDDTLSSKRFLRMFLMYFLMCKLPEVSLNYSLVLLLLAREKEEDISARKCLECFSER